MDSELETLRVEVARLTAANNKLTEENDLSAMQHRIDKENFNILKRSNEQLRAELAQAREQVAEIHSKYERLAMESKFEGNSVSYWYLKAKAYGGHLDKCWDELRKAGIIPNGKLDVAQSIEQLRAQLAAAMVWVPISEADLKHSEKVDIYYKDTYYNEEYIVRNCLVERWFKGWKFTKQDSYPVPREVDRPEMITHILRIKPPGEQQ